jgi:hypothetical protein
VTGERRRRRHLVQLLLEEELADEGELDDAPRVEEAHRRGLQLLRIALAEILARGARIVSTASLR